MTQANSIQTHRTAAAPGAPGGRGAAGAAADGAAPGAGFALLLAALGPGGDAGDALPGGQAGTAAAGAAPMALDEDGAAALALPQAGGAQTMRAAPQEPQDGEGGAPAGVLDPALLALLLAGQAPPADSLAGAAAPADAAAAVRPAALAAAQEPLGSAGAQPAGPAGLAAAAAAAGMPLQDGGEAGGRGHWLPAGLVAETGRIDKGGDAAESLAAPGAPQRPAMARGGRLPASAPGAALGGWGAARAAGSAAPGAALAAAAAAAPAGAALEPQPAGRLQAAPGLAGGPTPAPERPAGPEALAAQLASLAQAVDAMAQPAGAARNQDRAAGPGLQGGAAAGDGGLREPAERLVPGPDGAGQAGAQAGDAQGELAERVAWWVNQQTHSAALTLDQGGQPVQVQVALTGDQAHVTFRSDEAQARQLLDAGTAELRALLDAQGLQLAGVTVGHSGDLPAGQGRHGQRDEAPAPRQGQVRVPGSGAAPAAVQRGGATGAGGRAVDIFV